LEVGWGFKALPYLPSVFVVMNGSDAVAVGLVCAALLLKAHGATVEEFGAFALVPIGRRGLHRFLKGKGGLRLLAEIGRPPFYAKLRTS